MVNELWSIEIALICTKGNFVPNKLMASSPSAIDFVANKFCCFQPFLQDFSKRCFFSFYLTIIAEFKKKNKKSIGLMTVIFVTESIAGG